MKDSVIKGTGNSRYLKSSLEGITTWEQFRAALAAGTLPVDLSGINSEGFQQLGDPLNKVTFLKDGTAEKYGMDNTAVPDEVLDVLSKSVVEGTYPVVDVYAGQTWENGTAPNASGSVWQQIAIANNILFSFPISGTTAIMSTDGKTWTTFTIPTVSGGYDYGGRHRIVYVGDTYYLLIPITSSPYKAIIYTTQNLSTWTLKCTLSLTNIAYNLFYSNYLSKFVLIDIYGKVYLSGDAENWESTYSLGTSASSQPAFNNGIDGPDGFYIAVPASKKIQVFKLKSDSFETVFTSADLSNTIESVAFVKFKGKYFAYSAYGIAHSENLKDWQLSDANYQSSNTTVITIVQQLACSDVNVLIKYGSESLVSLDGLNFKRITDGVSSQQGSMAYINGVFCFHSQGAPSAINPYYTPDTTFKDEPGLVDVLGNMVNIPLKQIAGAASIETGTYTGTGGYGSSHSRALVFAKKPIIVFVFQIEAMTNNYDGGLCILFPSAEKIAIYGTNLFTTSENIFNAQDLTVSESGANIILKWTPVRDIYVGAMCNQAKKYAYAAFFSEEG